MKPLIIDHDDSFTHLLGQYFGELCGEKPKILNHRGNGDGDKEDLLEEIRAYGPSHIILSPGPGNVENEADFAIGHLILDSFEVPILGVCLGHQGIGAHFGAKIVRAEQVMHGKKSLITHGGQGIFEGLQSPLEVMRYHSLVISPESFLTGSASGQLEVTAQTEDGVIMALRHKKRPIFGVQFHPESVGSEGGMALLGNFLKVNA